VKRVLDLLFGSSKAMADVSCVAVAPAPAAPLHSVSIRLCLLPMIQLVSDSVGNNNKNNNQVLLLLQACC
jgi:hypothetical protein